MRTVTRTVLTSGAMLLAVGAAAAQAPEGVRPAVLFKDIPLATSAAPARSRAAVTERLGSFDADKDNRLSREEPPERMQGLFARGDKNADGLLDSDEIRELVTAASSAHSRVAFRPQSFDGLPGVISDLKLPPEKRARALEIVGAHTVLLANINDPASSGLHAEIRALLDDEEYENFVAAATRLSRSADIRFRTVGGVVGGVVGGLFAEPSVLVNNTSK